MIVTRNGGLSFEDGPDRARIIVSGEDTGGAYSLMEWTVAPSDQDGFGPHLHGTCEETFLIRGGSLEFLLGETVTTLRPSGANAPTAASSAKPPSIDDPAVPSIAGVSDPVFCQPAPPCGSVQIWNTSSPNACAPIQTSPAASTSNRVG